VKVIPAGPKPLRVTVGVPAYDHFKAEMAISLIGALLQFPYELHFTVQRSCYLDVNREKLAEEALAMESDYLVFVDTDLVFRKDAIERLLAHKKDIIGANYYEKRLPLVSTVKPLQPDGSIATDGKLIPGTLPDEPFRVGAVATGLMAINLKRLTQCMAPPFFAYGTLGTRFVGEDIAFAQRATTAGLEVWCDPTVSVLHMGEFPFGVMD
jgi:hypothetical protein